MAPFNFNPLTRTAGKTAIIERINLLAQKIKAAANIKVTGARTRRGPDGMNINVRPGGGNIQIAQFRVQTKHDDYLDCYSYVDGVLGNTLIAVALPMMMRRSAYEEYQALIASEVMEFVYHSVGARKLYKNDELFLYEYIIPPYTVATENYTGDIVIAVKFDQTIYDDDQVEFLCSWQDLNVDARCWGA